MSKRDRKKDRKKLPLIEGAGFTSALKIQRVSGYKDRVIAPIDYNPRLPHASRVFQKHHKSLHCRSELYLVT